jgi:hypothetical protein
LAEEDNKEKEEEVKNDNYMNENEEKKVNEYES